MDTLEQAKQLLRDNWKEGIECPCCHQYVKLYKRPAHTTMGLTLIRMYHLDQEHPNSWLAVRKIVSGISDTGTNDFSKFKHWGLVDEASNMTEKHSSGQWRITEKGKRFVEGKLLIPKYVLLFNKRCYGFTGNEINIKDVLGDKFNYEEIMGAKGQWL